MCPPSGHMAVDCGHIEHTNLDFLIKSNYTLLTCVSFTSKCCKVPHRKAPIRLNKPGHHIHDCSYLHSPVI